MEGTKLRHNEPKTTVLCPWCGNLQKLAFRLDGRDVWSCPRCKKGFWLCVANEPYAIPEVTQ